MNQLARINETGIQINDTNDLALAVRMIVESDLCPQQYRGKPKDAMIAILAGRAVGWEPIQALTAIAVINGRPSMYGDGPVGLAHASGLVDWINEWWELDGNVCHEPNYADLRQYPDSLTACWQTHRKDNSEPSKPSRFSVADAKAAGLWGKRGPWVNYPKRMLVCRARAWGLRDNYADALQGISQAEEWADMHPAKAADPLEAIEGEVVEPAHELPPPEPAVTAADKRQLMADVEQYLMDHGQEPAGVVDLIKATSAKLHDGKETIDTQAELAAVRAELLPEVTE